MSSEAPVEENHRGVILHVRVQPGAKKTELAGLIGGAIKVRVQAPPVEGAANVALIRFLSGLLKVSKSRVEVIRGDKSRRKDILIRDVNLEAVKEKIQF